MMRSVGKLLLLPILLGVRSFFAARVRVPRPTPIARAPWVKSSAGRCSETRQSPSTAHPACRPWSHTLVIFRGR